MWKWLWGWVMGRDWRSFVVLARERLPWRDSGRNVDVKGDSGEDSEQESSLQENLHLLREYINHHEQVVARNMNAKGASCEFSDGNEEYVI